MLDPYRDTTSGSLLFSREVARLYLSKTELGLSEVLAVGNEYFSNSEDLLFDNGLFDLTSSDDDLPGCSLLLSASLVPNRSHGNIKNAIELMRINVISKILL